MDEGSASLQARQNKKVSGQDSAEQCNLCGLYLGKNQFQLRIDDQTHRFCCKACLHVYQILSNNSKPSPVDFRCTDLYQNCVEAGLIPSTREKGQRLFAPLNKDYGNRVGTEDAADMALPLTFNIEGMWCLSCGWLIREILSRMDGIISAEILFHTDCVRIRYLPHVVDPKSIKNRIAQLGYQALPLNSPSSMDQKKSILRLGIATILTMNVMMLSFGLYGGFFQKLESTGFISLSLPIWLLTTPVVFYCGWPILRRACQGFLYKKATMDLLVAVGALTAYGYSMYQMMHSSLHLYFDTAAMLITLVLLGKFIENRVRNKVTMGINELHKLAGSKARVLKNGQQQWKPFSEIQTNDAFLVKKGERVAVDGFIAAGNGHVNEAILTGESQPVMKKIGSNVLAGSVLLEGELHITATNVGTKSSLFQMIELVHNSLVNKNPIEHVSDRLTRWFVPAIFLIAAATVLFLSYSGYSTEESLLRGLTILVIACPCSLGIAIPLAKVAVIEKGCSQGVIIRDAAAFEDVHRLNTILFDKTGTVTKGDYTLCDMFTPEYDEATILKRIVAVELHSDHFLARALCHWAKERGIITKPAANCKYMPGLGVKGAVDDIEVSIGGRQLIKELKLELTNDINLRAKAAEEQGLTIVFAGWHGRVQALFIFGDVLKNGAAKLMSRLRTKGINIQLISGDSRKTTEAIARQLRINNFTGQASPEDKISLVRNLQEKGYRVGMVGDGVNDAAALAQADVGFAVGSNPANLMEEAADVTLLGNSPERLIDVILLSKLLTKTIKQNLFFAFLYNGIGLPLAIMGLLNPLIAVLAMFASSLTVITNSLRVAGSSNHSPAKGEEFSNQAEPIILTGPDSFV